ncbi:MAG: hypothetical protein Q9160_000854 [Pyrenula sp. 1 TL-2023]
MSKSTLRAYYDQGSTSSSSSQRTKSFSIVPSGNTDIPRSSYNGKSTGAGALSVWTHHLKSISIINQYSSPSSSYTGPAIKMGAGVQGFEAYAAAHAQGLRVLGGECPSVGIAGGYTQGGGHSALASRYRGLAADQALEWELIDGTGTYRIANRAQNSELFWALSGGGAGTYGVVLSLTARAHADGPVSSANLTFTSTDISQDTYYAAVGAFNAILPSLVDAGAMAVWLFTNTSFTLSPLTAPDVPMEKLSSLLQPYLSTLDALGIPFTHVIRQFPDFLTANNIMQTPIAVGVAQYGGRLIPRSVVEENNTALTDAFRTITSLGGLMYGVGVDVGGTEAGDNAVHPAWRSAIMSAVVTTPFAYSSPNPPDPQTLLSLQSYLTTTLLPPLRSLTPSNGGCYPNEGSFLEPNWQDTFYSAENYGRLREIKERYDPKQLFWTVTGVGSETWEVRDDMRLCEVGR